LDCHCDILYLVGCPAPVKYEACIAGEKGVVFFLDGYCSLHRVDFFFADIHLMCYDECNNQTRNKPFPVTCSFNQESLKVETILTFKKRKILRVKHYASIIVLKAKPWSSPKSVLKLWLLMIGLL